MTHITMITQDVDVTRRIVQEAQALTGAGYQVRILTRADGRATPPGETAGGIPVERVITRGNDPRFRRLYRLAGVERGSNLAALWGVLTGTSTFTLRATPQAIAHQADIYHAHDLNNLPAAYAAARATGARLIYDAHELFAERANRWVRLKRGSWRRLEARLLPRCDLALTVHDFIAQEMARRYQVPPPVVVLNCPDPPPGFDPAAPHDHLRAALHLPAAARIVLYQGWISEGRGLENLVRAAALLPPSVVIVFMGYGDYQETLAARARAAGGADRVRFIPAVAQADLLSWCASADVGIIPYQPVDLNNVYSSPNKLFDFIHARVPLVASDLPFLRQVIAGHALGTVAKLDSHPAYAAALQTVLARPKAAYRPALDHAATIYTWQAQAAKLLAAYATLPPKK
jgi:glycosyltransferase involved in cell wall biosynthesis